MLPRAAVIQACLSANTVPVYVQCRKYGEVRIWMLPLPMVPAGSPVENR